MHPGSTGQGLLLPQGLPKQSMQHGSLSPCHNAAPYTAGQAAAMSDAASFAQLLRSPPALMLAPNESLQTSPKQETFLNSTTFTY